VRTIVRVILPGAEDRARGCRVTVRVRTIIRVIIPGEVSGKSPGPISPVARLTRTIPRVAPGPALPPGKIRRFSLPMVDLPARKPEQVSVPDPPQSAAVNLLLVCYRKLL
jgi:hypothetical protein